MRADVTALLDRRKLAIAGAKFRAWWDGAEFDEAAALAAIEAGAGPANDQEGAPATPDGAAAQASIEDELFEPEGDPRLAALQLLWGEGRLAPGESGDEAAIVARLALGEGAALALLGPGLAGPVLAFTPAATVSVFEWREETRAALAAGLAGQAGERGARIGPFDLDVTPLPLDAFDGLVSFDELTYGYAPHLALQMAKALKPGARAIVDCYVGPQGADLAHAFASAFAEPQVRPRSELEHAVSEAGFDIEAEEDLTGPHLTLARARFEEMAARFAAPQAPEPLQPGGARELAWEMETWRVRLRMLTRRRLERRRLLLRRRA